MARRMAGRRGLTVGMAALTLTAGIAIPAAAANAGTVTPDSRHGSRYQKVGYFTQWGIYARGFHVKDLVSSGTAGRMTTLNYAFGNVTADGVCASIDPWADYQVPFTADQTVN